MYIDMPTKIDPQLIDIFGTIKKRYFAFVRIVLLSYDVRGIFFLFLLAYSSAAFNKTERIWNNSHRAPRGGVGGELHDKVN